MNRSRVHMVAAVFAAGALSAAAAFGRDGARVVAAEVGCGYVGGFAGAVTGAGVGSLVKTDEFATGGLVGFFAAYPAGVGMGSWGAGEIWGDDSRRDWATAAAAVGGAYASVVVGYAVGSWKGLVIGMLVAPGVATVTYNVVKVATEPELPVIRPTYYVNYGFAF